MKDASRMLPVLAGIGAIALLFAGTAVSEVAVVESSPSQLYFLNKIIDDIDPVGSVWEQYSPAGSGRAVLNPEGEARGDGNPSILCSDFSGLPMVAWARSSPAGFDVVLSYYADAAWVGPIALADSADDELDPVLVVDPSDGSVLVFYWVHDASPRVLYRKAPADLSQWSAPVQVSHPGEVAVRPSATFYDGSLHVVYESHGQAYGATPRHIVLAIWENDSFVFDVVANTVHAGENWPQIHGAGDRLWVDWVDAADQIGWTRRIDGGQWEPVQQQSFESLIEREFHVRKSIKVQVLQ